MTARKIEAYSTEKAAYLARISYITLRRWLAKGDFQQWLKDQGKQELACTQLSNGKRIWQFTSANISALGDYCRLPERRKRERIVRRAEDVAAAQHVQSRKGQLRKMQQAFGRDGRMSAKDREVAKLIQRYVRVVSELKALGLSPDNEVLHYAPHTYVSEFNLREEVVRNVVEQDQKALAQRVGETLTRAGQGTNRSASPMLFLREAIQRRMFGR
jgi:hypothetical protein